MTNSDETIRTALFVDFDNIWIGLRDVDRDAAELFGTEPLQWLRWIERGLQGEEGSGQPRRVLQRFCYLNPKTFGRFRADFIRSGFRVIDCPPLTRQGKTSADIFMVMDILDTLNHPTRFEEFILMSGDADFTPVLLRLRRYDRRTVVVSAGYASPAYTAACDRLVMDTEFIDDALGSPSTSNATNNNTRSPVQADKAKKELTKPQLRAAVMDIVRQQVGASDIAVDSGYIANQVIQQLGKPIQDSDWLGKGTFTTFVSANAKSLGLSATSGSPTYIFDPQRHKPPEPINQRRAFEEQWPEMFELAARVYRATNTPLLTPEQYVVLFEQIAEELDEVAFTGLKKATKGVKDRCFKNGYAMASKDVEFVLREIQRSEQEFKSRDGMPAAQSLAETYAQTVSNLADRAQMELDDQEYDRLVQWFLQPHSEGEKLVSQKPK